MEEKMAIAELIAEWIVQKFEEEEVEKTIDQLVQFIAEAEEETEGGEDDNELAF